MAMSIVHRITGIALYFGMILIVGWLVAVATSRSWFDTANWLLGSWFGILVLIGFSWTVYHHMLGGIRHFIWDTGAGLEKKTSTLLSSLTLVGSLLLTAITWLIFFLWF